MRVRLLSILVLGVFLAACQTSQKRVTISSPSGPPNVTTQGVGSTIEWPIWEYWECSVPWNGTCTGTETEEAIAGWEVCKAFYRIASAGKGGPVFMATVNPNYRSVLYYFHVSGSQQFWDQWGSHLRVENIGMTLIRSPATAAQRQAAGCV